MLAPPIRLLLLGLPEVVDAEGRPVPIPVGKPLALLAYVHLQRDPVPRNELSEVFWPGVPERKARASLRQALWLLRKAVGEDLFTSDDPVALRAGWVTSDLQELRQVAQDDRSVAEVPLLWADPPFRHLQLPDVPSWDRWTDGIRSETEQLVAGALLRGAQQASSASDALPLLETAVQVNPHSAPLRLEWIDQALLARDFDQAELQILRARHAFPDASAVLHALQARSERLHALRREGLPSDTGRPPVQLPFVGRIAEYSVLAQFCRNLERGRQGRALITGAPGVGKSRLAVQAVHLAESAGARAVWVKAEEGDEALDWAFLADLLRGLLRLSGAAGISRESDRVISLLAPELTAEVPGVVGSGIRRDEMRTGTQAEPPAVAMAKALRDLLSAVTEDAPLVLSLDDLQWVDAKSRTVLLRVARKLGREPVLMLITCRTGRAESGLHRELRLLEETADFTRLSLSPLSVEEVGEAVTQFCDFTDPTQADRILAELFRKSQGNPLFLVEILRSLLERGLLTHEDDGTWTLHVAGIEDELPIPPSVRGLLELKLQDLPDEAMSIVRALGSGPQPSRPAELQRRSELGPAGFCLGLQRLLERGVVTWTSDDRLAFVHDEMVAVARRHFGPLAAGGRIRHGWRRWGAAAVAAAAALVLFLAGTRAFPSASAEDSEPLPFGGGEVVLGTLAESYRVTVRSGSAQEWPVEEERPGVELPPPGRIWPPFVGRDGETLWFAWASDEAGKPYMVRLTPEGPEPFFRTAGDDRLDDVTQDGTLALVRSQPPDPSGAYRLDLYLQPVDGGTPWRIYEAVEMLGPSRFSPDGTRIALRIPSQVDTLVVLRPSGEVVLRVPMGTMEALSWCGSDRVVAVVESADPAERLQAIDLPSGDLQRLPSVGFPTGPVACSPDGTALVHSTAMDGQLGFVLVDLGTGEWDAFPIAPAGIGELRWRPPTPTPRPSIARIQLPVQVDWGSAVPAQLLVETTSGQGFEPESSQVEWRSTDPEIAAFGPSGMLLANGPGRTRIEATWDGWLSAEAEIEVVGSAPEGGVFQDDFTTLDRDRWRTFGSSPPRAVRRDGEDVLLLDGDALHHDGIVERDARAYPRGVTAEVQVRIPLNRRDKQRFRLCLVEADPPASPEAGFEWFEMPARQSACFFYPNATLGAFHPGRGLLQTQETLAVTVDLEPHLPSDDWFEVALQFRPDGVASAWVNREYVGTSPLHLHELDTTHWRLKLIGSSWETEVLVRNLRVWEGARY